MKRVIFREIDAGESTCGACDLKFKSKREQPRPLEHRPFFCSAFVDVRKKLPTRLEVSVNGDPIRLDDCIKSEARARVAIGAAVERGRATSSREKEPER